jgi:nucleotide-binding universal stress UspA family protein
MQPRILVPYDFSPTAEQALRWADELKRSVGGGSIHLLYVLSPLPIAGVVAAIPLSVPCEEDLEKIEAGLHDTALRVAPGATHQAVLGTDVATQIIDTAQQRNADLIVMGTHGRGGVKRLVLGSIADYIVRHASCPVVTVRGSSADSAQPPRDGGTEEG